MDASLYHGRCMVDVGTKKYDGVYVEVDSPIDDAHLRIFVRHLISIPTQIFFYRS